MKKLAVALLVSFVAYTASATNWVEISSDPERKIYNYIDTESISTQSNYKQAFYKYIRIADEKYSVGINMYDCKSSPRQIKLTYFNLYDLNGNLTYSSGMLSRPFKPAFPETLAKTETDFICNF